ncbi:MAG: hypothetical protein IT223_03850 [Crocinitomicaceae bacterium]|nr:hypothetical protein [Crocinitomicaceae bacterium]
MKLSVSIVVLFFSTAGLLAQQSVGKQIVVSGKITELSLKDSSEKLLNGATVEVWADGKHILSMTSESAGRYQGLLPFHKVYRFHYKMNSYIGKIVEFDATDFLYDRSRAVAINIDMALFRNNNYMGLDFLSEVPIGKATYKNKAVVWDYTHTASVSSRIKSVLKAYGK